MHIEFDENGEEYAVGDMPLNPDVVHVEVLPDYRLLLTFETGERKRFDMTPYVGCSKFFEELRNYDYFSQAKVEGGTVEWPSGHNLCVDTFYPESVPVE